MSARWRNSVVLAAVALVLTLAVFAFLILQAQSQAREDVEQRFQERAQISAAVTQGIFVSSAGTTAAQASDRFAGGVDPAALERTVRQGQLAYAEILGPDGAVIAASSGAPEDDGQVPAHVRDALAGRTMLSNRVQGATGEPVFEWAIPFEAPGGTRIQLSGIRGTVLQEFIAGVLRSLPGQEDVQSAILDADGNSVGTPTEGVAAGDRYPDGVLLEKIGDGRRAGSYGDGRYFAGAPFAGSPWTVVLTTAEDDLYSEINGARRTVPWIIFAALALIGVLTLLALQRVARARSELDRRELNRRHALEINDNVIQRLALVKYALEAGHSKQSEAKLTETIHEAQRLVNQLLGDEPVSSGDFRRTESADTAGSGIER